MRSSSRWRNMLSVLAMCAFAFSASAFGEVNATQPEFVAATAQSMPVSSACALPVSVDCQSLMQTAIRTPGAAPAADLTDKTEKPSDDRVLLAVVLERDFPLPFRLRIKHTD